MRVLFIDVEEPFPPDQGDRIRGYRLVEALSTLGHRVTLATRNPRHHRAWQALGVTPLPLAPGPARYRPDLPLSARIQSARLAPPSGAWELALGHGWPALPLLQATDADRRILDLTDALGLFRQRARALLPPTRRLRLDLLTLGVERAEASPPALVDEVWVSGASDLHWLVRRNPRWRDSLRLVPNGTAPAQREFYGPGPGGLYTVGNFHYPPNREGIVRFLREAWPRLRSRVPDLTLDVVGAGSRSLPAAAGLRRLGYLADPSPVIRAARALLVPVRFGAGTRGKILEAWAHGKPVISTLAGAEGLPREPAPTMLLGETLEELAELVAAVHGDPERLLELGRNGFAAARALDWSELIAQALGRRP